MAGGLAGMIPRNDGDEGPRLSPDGARRISIGEEAEEEVVDCP